MKKFYLRQLFVAMIAVLCSVSAGAIDFYEFEAGGIYYSVNSWSTIGEDNRVSVSENRNAEYSGNIVIPESVTYEGETFKVAAIKNYAFMNCAGLTGVTIPKSITSIGACAFQNCTALKSVAISEGIETIEEKAFFGCSALVDVTIPASIKSVGYEAFASTAWYDNLPDGAVYIGGVLYAYKGTIPYGTSLEIKEGTTIIGKYAFMRQAGLVNITIPNSVTSIEQGAFGLCTGLASVAIPSSLTSIDDEVFYGCSALASVAIPVGVTSIGHFAFNGCSALTGITIPESVTYIGSSAFNGCSALSSVAIPGNVTVIEDKTFSDCSCLTDVTIGNGVAGIGNEVFMGCVALENVTIPASVTNIGVRAFYECSSLVNVYINDLVAWCSIEHTNWSNPLNYAQNLYLNGELVTSVTIPGGVKEIKNEVFVGYDKLESVTIPEGVTSIGNYAFQNCTGLTSVALPNSVVTIGSYAFNGCSALENITFGENIANIGVDAFYGTAWLSRQPDGPLYAGKLLYSYAGTMPEGTSIEIKEGTLGIASRAFNNCSGLVSITIPESVARIGYYAFYNCSSLETVNINNLAAWLKVDNNHSRLFDYVRKLYLNGEVLKDVVIPEEITEIKDCAFCDYDSLESITIHEGVTSIGDSAFYQCRGLKTITIPESVASIGEMAFCNCRGLETVVLLQSNPQNLSVVDNTFQNVARTALLCVPAGSMEAYKADSGWASNFKCMAEMNGNVIAGECSENVKWTLDQDIRTLTLSGNGDVTADNASWTCFSGLIDYVVVGDGINVLTAEPFEETGWYSSLPGDGLVYIGKSLMGYKSGVGSLAAVVDVKEGTRVIADKAFSNDTIIEKVNTPSSLEYIGERAFYNCSLLTSVGSENVKHIGERAFYGCSSLAAIDLKSVETIGSQAFRSANLCSEITLPRLKSIGSGAFERCASLERVKSLGNITELPASVFSRVPLKELDIPGTVKSIGEKAFEYTLMQKIVIPNGVESIASYAFRNNESLDTLIIASHSVSLEANVFQNCKNIDAVYILSDNVPEDGGWSTAKRPFITGGSRPSPRGILYVPLGCKDQYPSLITMDFLDVVEMDMTELRQATGIETPVNDGCAVSVSVNGGKIVLNGCKAGESVCIYSVDGRLLRTVAADGEPVALALDKGVYIVRIGGNAVVVKL